MLAGQGLHTAAPATVTFARAGGPVRVGFGEGLFTVHELRVAGSERSTTVETPGGTRLGTVEHLFAALAGLGVHEGVAVRVEGPEVPLLDGCASAFASAVASLGVAQGAPRLRVVRRFETEIDGSRYVFEPASSVEVIVEIDFADTRLEPRAAWHGDADDFMRRIAPARTFGFEREVTALMARGLASHVAPESVVVLGDGRILSAGPPFRADEPARHKLLDLLGDMFLYGAPVVGRVTATAPGHARTHAAMRAASAAGVFADALG